MANLKTETPLSGREKEIYDFQKRKFSGKDLLMIMDHNAIGVGVGGTMSIIKEIELRAKKDKIYSTFDYPIDNA